MAFSYDLTTDVGRVRLLIGDTLLASAKFQDEEIEYFLGVESSNVYLSAALCADAMAMRAADNATAETIGNYSINQSSKADKWLELAKQLRAKDSQTPAFDVCDDITTSFHDPDAEITI